MSNLLHSNSGTAQPIRCAIYARYSSDVQKSTSIEDQVRNCRELADQMGWVVLPEYIRSDEGISGAALDTRPAILSLREDAKKHPRPFDYILVDSTSRFGRELSDTLKLTKVLKYHDVNLYFVTQRLDTKERYARKLQTVYGMQDEDFLEAHRENVHRGLKGIALKGYHTGGTHFGYKRILKYHPTDKDEHGRPAVDHVELEIDAEQAAIVLEIFTLRARHYSFRNIAKYLNGKSIPAPRGGVWGTSTLKRIIKDELYRGVMQWNRKKNEMNPESYAITRKPNPETSWAVAKLPQLRMISEELWDKVQEVNKNAKRFRKQLGGENRTANSRTYLFSGLLKCGLCMGSIGTIGGPAGTRRIRYGCRAHRSQGSCPNDLTIRLDRLEEQLVGAIFDKLTLQTLEEYVREYQAQIEDYLAKESRAGKPDEQALRKRLEQLEREQSNVAGAIATIGPSDALLKELTRIETEKKEIMADLARANNPAPNGISLEEFRTFVRRAATDLNSVLRGDPALAKAGIKRAVRHLVLTPVQSPEGRVFKLTGGDIDLFAGHSGVLLGTAVEHSAKHYTPLLSLTGLQLDPRRTIKPSSESGKDPELPSRSLVVGIAAVPALAQI